MVKIMLIWLNEPQKKLDITYGIVESSNPRGWNKKEQGIRGVGYIEGRDFLREIAFLLASVCMHTTAKFVK